MQLWQRPTRAHRRGGQVEGLGDLPRQFVQGVRKAGGDTPQADGQGGVSQLQDDVVAGHHRRSEGTDLLQRGSFWSRSRREAQACSSPEEAEGKTFSIALERQGHQLPVAEPTYKKGIQGGH